MKGSYCFFLLPILVASAGCPNTDNNVGSLGQDAGAAGSSGQDAGGAPGQPTDAASMGQDAGQKPPAVDGPISASTCVTYLGQAGPCTGTPDAGVPDAAPVGKDTAQDSPEAGAAHQCQLSPDGTCSATLPVACTTDDDCCVAIDTSWGHGYLVGRAEYDSMLASIASISRPGIGVACTVPGAQVQCKNGFCSVGNLIRSSRYSTTMSSHCGALALAPDDVVAVFDSSRTTWGCVGH
jgi:hypothetical protein